MYKKTFYWTSVTAWNRNLTFATETVFHRNSIYDFATLGKIQDKDVNKRKDH